MVQPHNPPVSRRFDQSLVCSDVPQPPSAAVVVKDPPGACLVDVYMGVYVCTRSYGHWARETPNIHQHSYTIDLFITKDGFTNDIA